MLEARCLRRRRDLKTLCVLQTIGRPGHGVEPCLFNGTTVDDAPTERAIGYAAQGVTHVLQHLRIVFGFGKFL